jgi:hypothetical protein
MSASLSAIAEFSREHCVALCAFLVPINLAIALQTLILLTLNRPAIQWQRSAYLALPFATILCLHVGTWLAIGVVHPFTFILLGLATLCLTVNGVVLLHPTAVRDGIYRLLSVLARWLGVQQLEN